MRRIGDVLEPLLAEIDEFGRNRAAHMAPRIGGDANPAGRGEAFEARGDIDTVAVDVVRRYDDISEIDADAELDAAVVRQPGIAVPDQPLHVQRTAHCIDGAGELGEDPVPGVFDDAATV